MSKNQPPTNLNQQPKPTPTPTNNIKQPSTAAATANTESVDLHVFENIDYPHCSDVSKYEKVIKIGQGTFG
jgi:hypothetical protein